MCLVKTNKGGSRGLTRQTRHDTIRFDGFDGRVVPSSIRATNPGTVEYGALVEVQLSTLFLFQR